MKRIHLCLVVIISVVLFCSCSSSEIYKFGFLMPNSETEYYIKAREYFGEIIEEKGGIVEYRFAEDNERNQIIQAEELIELGVDVLVISAIDVNTAAEIVRNANKHRVKVVAYDRMIHNCDLDFFVTYDSKKVGEMMADYALKNHPKGDYVLFYGDAGDGNAHLVKSGMLERLKPSIESNDVNIVYQGYIDNWSGDNASHMIDIVLDYSMLVPDVLLSSYDGMSTGAINAMNKHDFNRNVLVTGQNGEIEAFQNILIDKQAMTVYKPVKNLSKLAANVAWNLASGTPDQENVVSVNNGRLDVPSILMDPILIDKNNIQSLIIDEGIYSKDELGL